MNAFIPEYQRTYILGYVKKMLGNNRNKLYTNLKKNESNTF